MTICRARPTHFILASSLLLKDICGVVEKDLAVAEVLLLQVLDLLVGGLELSG